MKRMLVTAALAAGLVAAGAARDASMDVLRQPDQTSILELPDRLGNIPPIPLPSDIILDFGGAPSYSLSEPEPLDRPSPTKVDLDVLPEKAPDAVMRRANDAVVVSVHKHRADGTDEKVSYGSGVRIGNDLYLTAGHLVLGSAGTAEKASADCGTLDVEATRKDIFSPLFGEEDIGRLIPADESYGIFHGDEQPIPDIALVETAKGKESGKVGRGLALGRVAVGDTVYFVNYKPAKDGEWRSPYQTASTSEHLDQPAIFGGVVVRRNPGGDLVVIEGLKSYGQDEDAFGGPGMSGGPVYNARGELVGLSVRVIREPLAAEDLGEQLGVDLGGIDPERMLSYTAVQPVTKTQLDLLATHLSTLPSCTDVKVKR